MSTSARLTVTDFERMTEAGVFDRGERRRLEFIRGEIRDINPIGAEHEVLVDRLTEWSFQNVPKGTIWIRVQNSIWLPGLESVPEPDIAWVVRRDYSQNRPSGEDVLLLIEVAGTSLAYDRSEKADLYAQAAIADYWLINLPEQTIEVRRDPGADHYRSLQTFSGEDEIRPIALPELTLQPAMLWTPIEETEP